MSEASCACPICGSATKDLGTLRSTFSQRTYHLRRCRNCWFGFIADPWTDYATIYSDAYYAGDGADPHLDYRFEFDRPEETIRRYEWRGIREAVKALVPLTPTTRWMDYGCGNGGLVRYLHRGGYRNAVGFDTGSMADTARRSGVPIITDDSLPALAGTFDIVTAIEVIEHLTDPIALLADIRRLLRPGGLLFLTTGNAQPFRERLLSWSYVLPDVHVSFFEPGNLSQALEQTGFRTERRGYLPGFTDIIRFKVLKNLGLRRVSRAEQLLPWPVISRVIDARFHVSAHPIGWAV